VLGYWDPIGLANLDLWGQGEEASIGTRTLPPQGLSACVWYHGNGGLALASRWRLRRRGGVRWV
jgi:hypothetical protein